MDTAELYRNSPSRCGTNLGLIDVSNLIRRNASSPWRFSILNDGVVYVYTLQILIIYY